MKQSRLWPVLWPKIEEILSSVPPPNDFRLEISGLLLLGADLKISVSYEGESTQWMGQDDGYYSRSDLTVQTNKVTLIQRLLRLSYEIWIETGSLSASSCQLNSHRETLSLKTFPSLMTRPEPLTEINQRYSQHFPHPRLWKWYPEKWMDHQEVKERYL